MTANQLLLIGTIHLRSFAFICGYSLATPRLGGSIRSPPEQRAGIDGRIAQFFFDP